VPYEKLDDATARVSAKKLATMIALLQPMLERKTGHGSKTV